MFPFPHFFKFSTFVGIVLLDSISRDAGVFLLGYTQHSPLRSSLGNVQPEAIDSFSCIQLDSFYSIFRLKSNTKAFEWLPNKL